MTKIVSYSLFGDNNYYLRGAIFNARDVKKFYPGWECRFYTDTKVPEKVVKELERLGSNVIIEDDDNDFSLGLYWRFKPMFELPKGTPFIVRDADSTIIEREVHAVNEWLDSGKDFHTMRDHPFHTVNVLSGMWGAKAGCVENFKELMEAHQKEPIPNPNKRGRHYWVNQMFLSHKIWNIVKDRALAHDDKQRLTGKELLFKVPPEDSKKFVAYVREGEDRNSKKTVEELFCNNV